MPRPYPNPRAWKTDRRGTPTHETAGGASLIASSGALAGGGGASPRRARRQRNHQRAFKIALSMSYVGNDWQIRGQEPRRRRGQDAAVRPARASSTPTSPARPAQGARTSTPDRADAADDRQGLRRDRHLPDLADRARTPVDQAGMRPRRGRDRLRRGAHRAVRVQRAHQPVAAGTFHRRLAGEALHGKGDSVEANGVPGTRSTPSGAQGRRRCGEVPNTRIAQFPGLWDQANTQQGMARVLGADHNIDGVWHGRGHLLRLAALHRRVRAEGSGGPPPRPPDPASSCRSRCRSTPRPS